MIKKQLSDSDGATYIHPAEIIEPIENDSSAIAQALLQLVCWIQKSKQPMHIGARVMVLSNALNIQNESFAAIARTTGISREGVRLMAKELETIYGLRPNNSRSDATRRRCRDARNRHKQC